MSRVSINPNNLKLVTLSGTQQSTLSVANIISLNTLTGNNEITLGNVSVGNIINSKLITSSNLYGSKLYVSDSAEIDQLNVLGSLTSNSSIVASEAYFNYLNMNNGNVVNVNNLNSVSANVNGVIVGQNLYLNGISLVNGSGTFSSNLTANNGIFGSINSSQLNSNFVTVSNAINTKTANVTGSLGAKNLFTNGAYFIDSGISFTANVTMNNANINSANINTLEVGSETIYGNLVVTDGTNSTIISNGNLSTSQMSINGNLTSLNINVTDTLNVAGKVTMGQLAINNGNLNLNNGFINANNGNIANLTVNNILTVNGLNANNSNIITSGNVQAGNLVVGNIISQNMNIGANLITSTLTSNVVNLGTGNLNTSGYVTVSSTVVSSSLNTGSGTISTSGTVNAGNVITNKLIVNGDFGTSYTLSANVANINSANITGNLNAGNINALNMFITSNIAAGNIITSANLSILGNIISKGLNIGSSGLTTTGDINGANVIASSISVRNNGSLITTGGVVAGAGIINGNMLVGGNLQVNGSSNLLGNVSINNNLTTNNANVNSLNVGTISFSDAEVSGTLNFNSGRTIISGNTLSTGVITSALMNTNSLTATGTMNVDELSVNGNLISSGNVYASNGIFTSNVSTANLIVTYAIIAPNVVIANGSTMDGNISTANLNVSGTLIANKIISSNIQDILDLNEANIGQTQLYQNISTLNHLLSKDNSDNLYLGDKVLGNIYIGSSGGAQKNIFIGSSTDTVVIQGTVTNVLSTNTQFVDNAITLNKNGASLSGAGILIENSGTVGASMLLNNYGKFVFTDISGRTYDLANIADGNFPQIYANGNIDVVGNVTTYSNLTVNSAIVNNSIKSTNIIVSSNIDTENVNTALLVSDNAIITNATIDNANIISQLTSTTMNVTTLNTNDLIVTNNSTVNGNVIISDTLISDIIQSTNLITGSTITINNTLTSSNINTNSIELNGNLSTSGTVISNELNIDGGNITTLDDNYTFKVNGYTHFGLNNVYDENKFGIVTITTDATNPSSAISFVKENSYAWQMGYKNDGSNDFYIYDGGVGVKLSATNSQSWSSVSDARYKRDIITIDNCLEKIENIRGVYYNYNSDKEGSQRKVGVVAQEVLAAIPEIVDVPNNEDKPLSVRYQELTPILLNAMKEIMYEINSLKNEVSLLL